MTRVAAIDLGTNSVRLLVADVPDAGAARDSGGARLAPVEVLRRSEVVRLGEGVDATGRLADAALARTRARLEEYAGECSRLGVVRLAMAATSATRDAANRDDLDAIVRAALAPWGARLRVLSGDEEARATFTGAVAAVRAAGLPGPYVVVDLGGGSTEVVRGDTAVEDAVSLDLGAVRQHERLAVADPLSGRDVTALEAAVDAALPVGLLTGAATLVGVAGTATTVTAHRLGLERYDAQRVHLDVTTPGACAAAARDLAARTNAQRAQLAYVTPGRADILGVGSVLWARIVERAQAAGVERVVTSEHDILDGILPVG